MLADGYELGWGVVVRGEVVLVEFAEEDVLFGQAVDLAVALGDVPARTALLSKVVPALADRLHSVVSVAFGMVVAGRTLAISCDIL